MATRTTEIKKPTTKKKVEGPLEEVTENKTEKHDKAIAAIDDLLDSIDEVLEVNASDFLAAFIQAGGE